MSNSIQERLTNAQSAKKILNNKFFLKVMEDLDKACVREWRNAQDTETQHKWWIVQAGTNSVVNAFQSVIDDGKIAESELQQQQDQQEGKNK